MMNKILPIELKKSKHKITPYGGLLLTYESILGLGLDKWLGRELEDIGKLRADQTLKDMLKQANTKGKGVIPSSDAAGDWLRRMGGKKRADGRADGAGLLGLGRVQGGLCNRILDELGVDEVTLDADATVIAADKEEADWTYKKVKGFQPMLGYVAETGICLYDEFRAGNVPAGQGAVEFIEACRRQLTGSRRIKAIRSDGAWYQAEVFNWATDNNALFAIAADQDQAVREAISLIPETEWKTFLDKNGHETDRQIAETVHSMGKTKAAFRLIVQRWRVNKSDNQLSLFGEEVGYAYFAIASNREGSAAEVVYWYNQRGCCENWIKEGKLGFGLEYLPCSQLGANAVFFCIGLLAYNLSIAMKLLVFPKAYQARQISTIRWRVYEWAGYLVSHAGKLALRISAPVEFIRFFTMCRHRCWLLSSG